ncbi:MAG: ERCC4 domain-containing protein [Candidatus Aminicenantes bacterium]|nr:ERCC4 domain-containing protein [Candidatus Aminicenantes bacterium]
MSETRKFYWVLQKTNDKKFPYRLTIRDEDENEIIALYVQDRWPGARGNIFCLREKEKPEEEMEEVERVPIVNIKKYGKRLIVILDRKIKKRCDFLFLKKKYKNKDSTYEQIFWRTEIGLKERRPKVKIYTYADKKLNIVKDSNERYGWNFGKNKVLKAKLPVGDYALMSGDEIIAVVERKTFNNIISEFGNLAVFYQKLAELESYKNSALVIEANYSDFLSSKKIKYYTPSFCAKVFAEISALFPNLKIIFAGNRKLAREWTLRFFVAINSHQNKED